MKKQRERGFALLMVFLMAAAIAISLYMELPRVAFETQRNRELLTVSRAQEYQRAIQLFVRANKRYPSKIEDLESFNDKRYLRHRFINPLTGKDDWRLVHVGPNGMLTDSLVKKNNNPLGGKDDKDKEQQASNTDPTATGDPNAPAGGLNLAKARRPGDVMAGQLPQMGSTGVPVAPGTDPAQQTGYPPPQYPQQAGQPFPGQYPPQYPGQPYPGQQQVPGQVPGQQVPGQYPPQYPGQPQFQGQPGQPQIPGQPGQPQFPVQPGQPQSPGQPMPSQPVPGQPYYPGQPYPGQPVGIPPYPGQPVPGQPFPQQPGQPYPSQYPGQPVPGQPQYPQMPPVQGQYNPNQQYNPNPAQGFNPNPGPNQNSPQTNPGLNAVQNQIFNPTARQSAFKNPQPGGGMGTGIAGVGIPAEYKGEGIMVIKERSKYREWEFIYDPKEDKTIVGAAGAPGGANSLTTPNNPGNAGGFGNSSTFGNTNNAPGNTNPSNTNPPRP